MGVSLHQNALTDKVGAVTFNATSVSELASLLSPSKRMQKLSVDNKYDYESIDINRGYNLQLYVLPRHSKP